MCYMHCHILVRSFLICFRISTCFFKTFFNFLNLLLFWLLEKWYFLLFSIVGPSTCTESTKYVQVLVYWTYFARNELNCIAAQIVWHKGSQWFKIDHSAATGTLGSFSLYTDKLPVSSYLNLHNLRQQTQFTMPEQTNNIFLTTENLAFSLPLLLVCASYVRHGAPLYLNRSHSHAFRLESKMSWTGYQQRRANFSFSLFVVPLVCHYFFTW